MAADQLFIGIDSGTQGTKAVALSRETGQILAEAFAPHDIIENNQGRREQNPAWWIAACESVLGELSANPSVAPGNVIGIGVSGQQHGFTPLDAEGNVIRPAKLWCDTETAKQCETITSRAGGSDKVISLIGNSVAAGFTASKILWLKENEPANYERLATILLPHDYINFWLTGERVTECGDASGTAYFDVAKREWSTPLLDAIDPSGRLSAALPRLIDSREPAGRIRPELAKRFGFSSDALVSSGGGDNMMAAIGTGNVRSGVVTASFGTSGTIYARADQPVIDPKGELAAFCSSDGGWLPLICTMNVTVSTELVRDMLGIDTSGLNVLAQDAPAGAEGLVLLPYFNGERTPALPKATASLHGMSSTNYTRQNLCRAAMEGATLGMRYGLEVLRRLGMEPDEIRLVGGGAKSPLWRSIAASVFNTPVVRPEVAEAGALGGALQAMWCVLARRGEDVGLDELADRYVHLDATSGAQPDPSSAALYDELYGNYLEINGCLLPVNDPRA